VAYARRSGEYGSGSARSTSINLKNTKVSAGKLARADEVIE
jgi:hypothetical protein